MTDSVESKIIRFVQMLLLEEEDKSEITPALIYKKIDCALELNPKWSEIDRNRVTDELIRRFSIWIGNDTGLVDTVGHKPWLDASRKQDWRLWQRYRELTESKLSWDIADKLDKSTDKILGMLEDPLRPGNWDRRGLVVGHVQSGKTASYTGLVCKAADAQYKVIIILAGLHNNLRSQTQIRLEEGFLGYETNSESDMLRRIGVGLIDTDMTIKPNCATTRADNGDFGGRAATQLAITPEQRPWLFVVKKNKSVLVRLLKWIQNHVADLPIQDTDSSLNVDENKLPLVKKKVTQFPLLIIDDEADNASVDTGETVVDQNGKPDEEHQPTTINKLIRRLLHSFSRSAYVGYTATPFANIFIHERGETKNEGLDLFPSAFIQSLAAPSNYVGPSTVFGNPSPDGRKDQLPLVKAVTDFQSEDKLKGWMPSKHKIWHIPAWSTNEPLPPSLREALDSFVLVCAIRNLRGQENKHSSMLIHVTRFNQVQKLVKADVEKYIKELRQKIVRSIGHEEILQRLLLLWEKDFLPTTNIIREAGLGDIPSYDPTWHDVVDVLPDVLNDIDIKMINGTAKDALDYEENQEKGLKVIAIGGDKLARGLTLEGLCTSYFLRASKMYDTLMQMGRWFGYRPGYLDLCRLYTSPDLVRWFQHISDAAAELREEFDLMANSGATPREFGLKVQSHSELMVTSQIKMRSAKTLLLSYSGQLMQTISFSKGDLGKNVEAVRRFVELIGSPTESGELKRSFGDTETTSTWHGHLWCDKPAQNVIDLLSEYRTSNTAHRVNSAVLSEFIQKMTALGELTDWDIALIGNRTGNNVSLAPGIEVNKVSRKAEFVEGDRFSIGVLTDPKDEAIGLDTDQWNAALKATVEMWKAKKEKKSAEPPTTPSGPAIRKIRGLGAEGVPPQPEKGLLIIYVVDPKIGDNIQSDVIAFGISFPGSKADIKVEYKVNNVGWEQDYGDSE
ncbi:Z1 domain-containing protein [Dickeya zeae]|uniref:Z1 domain-containing protein n=1 Tax=Dickeya zeae TaxID=204042 RepID=UPI00039F401F|nr:Z1 domain-containing protein [Dickeya zeae]